MHVLRLDGIAACSMASVAAQAGMTPASLYRYFTNIEAVLHEVAARQLDVMHEQLDDALSGLTSADEGRDAVLTAFGAYERAFRSDRAMLEIWAGSMSLPALISLNIAASRRNAQLIVERLAPFRSVPIHPERAFLYCHLIGSGVLLLLQVEQADLPALRDELREMVISLLDEQRSDERRRLARRRLERRSLDRRGEGRQAEERRMRDRRATDRRGGVRRLRDGSGHDDRTRVVSLPPRPNPARDASVAAASFGA